MGRGRAGRFTVLTGLPANSSSDVTSCAGGHPVSLPDSCPRAITKSTFVKRKEGKSKRERERKERFETATPFLVASS